MEELRPSKDYTGDCVNLQNKEKKSLKLLMFIAKDVMCLQQGLCPQADNLSVDFLSAKSSVTVRNTDATSVRITFLAANLKRSN